VKAPIFQFNEQRDDLVHSVVERVVSEARDPALLLNDAAYHELRRLESASEGERAQTARWRRVARAVGTLDNHGARALLREIAELHARDVAGNFDRTVYTLASRVAPAGLSVLLSPQIVTQRSILEVLRGEGLADRIMTSGPVDRVRRLAELGTVVYVPTHLSNLDSPVFAYALESSELPPVTYGAGKNLFTNPVLSFFMRNLGAYRVDRRLKHELYKQVLKTYSCLLIERGFHSLFFPGGTRSRSGGVERKLKLGLAGTGLEAFVRTSLPGKGPTRRVFFVPATINYMLTLEAETLIDDHLKEQGKARYIIEDDESTRLARISAFVRKLFQMEGSCAVRFGAPVDPFGNVVDDEGRSHDAHGRPVDAKSYVTQVVEGQVAMDAARDTQYTRELGEVVVASYLRDTIAMPTHIVATAAFGRLLSPKGLAPGATHPHVDLFAVVRKSDVVVPLRELLSDVETLQTRLVELERRGEIQLAPAVRGATSQELLRDAERALNGYHSSPVLRTRDDGVALLDPKVLLYYQNRLAAHGVAYAGGVSK
jgi:glycerol-3-phosphate O-acyltransferase